MKIYLSPATLIYFAIALILCHDLSLIAIFSAVIVHELTHLIALWILGGEIISINITPLGLSIERSGLLSHTSELIMSLSAPIMNLILAVIFFYFNLDTCTTGANLGLGLLNILPIFPLDGGKAFHALLHTVLSPIKAAQISELVTHIFLVSFWMIGIAIALVINGGLSMLMLSVGLFITIAQIGISNK